MELTGILDNPIVCAINTSTKISTRKSPISIPLVEAISKIARKVPSPDKDMLDAGLDSP